MNSWGGWWHVGRNVGFVSDTKPPQIEISRCSRSAEVKLGREVWAEIMFWESP